MVGVPGKSKGCITCRKRKVKCDSVRPDCERCVKSGRHCEGYDRFPTFLNRTQQGLSKRKAFEEAKPRQWLCNPTDRERAFTRSDSSSSSEDSDSNCTSSTLYSPVDNRSVLGAQYFAAFLSQYYPKPSGLSPRDYCYVSWLWAVPTHAEDSTCLSMAMNALAFSRLGFSTQNQDLVKVGTQCYGFALHHLQQSLWNPQSVWKDSILGTALCLMMYELFNATSDCVRGWNNHVQGMATLIKLRGPKAYRTSLSRAALRSYAYTQMIQSLQWRSRSFLDDKEWRVNTFVDGVKDIDYRLFEHGFELSGIFEDSDVSGLLDCKADLAACLTYVERYESLLEKLDEWWNALEHEVGEPIFSVEAAPGSQYTIDDAQYSLHYPRMQNAISAITYWSVKSMALGFAAQTFGSLLSSHPAFHTPSSPKCAVFVDECRARFANMVGAAVGVQCKDMAVRIIQSMPYMLSSDSGTVGAQQSIFPLRAALKTMERVGPEHLHWARRYNAQLWEDKGIQFAYHIASPEEAFKTIEQLREAQEQNRLPLRVSEALQNGIKFSPSSVELKKLLTGPP